MSVRATSAAAVLGAATGIRSMAGLTALTVALESGRPRGSGTAAWLLSRAPVRMGVRAAAAGEVLADKVAPLPPRTDPLPLAGRVVLGALAGSVAARLAGGGGIAPALVGGLTAGLVAVGATRLRADATAAGVPDAAVALAEDATVAVLSGVALRGM